MFVQDIRKLSQRIEELSQVVLQGQFWWENGIKLESWIDGKRGLTENHSFLFCTLRK
jgi:hypothetical protein